MNVRLLQCRTRSICERAVEKQHRRIGIKLFFGCEWALHFSLLNTGYQGDFTIGQPGPGTRHRKFVFGEVRFRVDARNLSRGLVLRGIGLRLKLQAPHVQRLPGSQRQRSY